jgi:hypothetical protein
MAFAQGHRVAEAVENWQQFPESPDTGVVQCLSGASTLSPQPFERTRIGPVMALALTPARVFHFKQVSTEDATEVRLGFLPGDSRPASETAQLVQIVVHVC